jgi:hypothetical protein
MMFQSPDNSRRARDLLITIFPRLRRGRNRNSTPASTTRVTWLRPEPFELKYSTHPPGEQGLCRMRNR